MQMLTSKDTGEGQIRSSAFKPVGACAKSPSFKPVGACAISPAFQPVGTVCYKSAGGLCTNSKKRDSGYSSDFSPARVKTQDETFTFDAGDEEEEDVGVFVDDTDISAAISADISADEYVFEHQLDSAMNAIIEQDETDDEATDREVEDLLDDRHSKITCEVSGLIHRPVAPLPSPDVDEHSINRLSNCRSEVNELCLIASPYYHTRWNLRDRVLYINPFRPIVSRSVGTQTPNPHSQLVQDAFRSNTHTLNSELIPRRRLQVQSTNEQVLLSLPDVVPMSRDRSISLPDVQSFHRQEQQQQVGRELRRISDDYHSTYLKRQNRRTRTRSEELSLLRLRVDVPACWNTLRRFVSSSPLFQAWSTDTH